METKAKTFDCVEMKRKAQEMLQDEFDSRRQEFATFTEFLNAKAKESDWVASILGRFSDPSK